jgi:hypothetical protein
MQHDLQWAKHTLNTFLTNLAQMVRVVHTNRAAAYPNIYNYVCTLLLKYWMEPEVSKPILRYRKNLKVKSQF